MTLSTSYHIELIMPTTKLIKMLFEEE